MTGAIVLGIFFFVCIGGFILKFTTANELDDLLESYKDNNELFFNYDLFS